MALQDEITKAIGAHGMWKTRLRMAVESGKVDYNIAEVQRDNCCEFGRWLHHANRPVAMTRGAHFTRVRDLHASFHRTAGQVLNCVQSGRRTEGNAVLAGEFADVSEKLTRAMMDWKAEA